MGYQRNDKLYLELRQRYAELQKTNTVGDESPKKALAMEYALKSGKSLDTAYQMVCYYLRGGNKRVGSIDSRRAYSDRELANLELMTLAERTAYAKHTGRSLRAVDAARARYRKASAEYARLSYADKITKEDIESKKYFDFGSDLHLKLQGLTRKQVNEAKAILYATYGLSLRAPNILYHNTTKRRYLMATAEQRVAIESPKRFLAARAAFIKEGWVTGDCDPVADDSLSGELPVSPFTKTHKHTRHKTVKAALVASDKLISLLPNVIRDESIQEGTVYHTSLKTLKIWLDRTLELAHPKDSFIDKVNYPAPVQPMADLKVKNFHYSCTRCSRIVSATTQVCSECKTTTHVVKVEEVESNKALLKRLAEEGGEGPANPKGQSLLSGVTPEEDEDAWMKDWKPSPENCEEE